MVTNNHEEAALLLLHAISNKSGNPRVNRLARHGDSGVVLISVDVKQNKSVLWAYKKDLLGFTSHRKKREMKIKKEVKRGIREPNQEDPLDGLDGSRKQIGSHGLEVLQHTHAVSVTQNLLGFLVGIREPNQEDPFELFITLNQIRYVYYKETEKILGNTVSRVNIHGHGVELLQTGHALQKQDHQTSTLDGLDGSRKQIGDSFCPSEAAIRAWWSTTS
jgi:hypothetical protein